MFLGKRLKELREQKEFLQRQLAAKLEIDTPMYSKIERGERNAKREQVQKLSKIFEVEESELLTLWLAGKIYDLIKDESIAKSAIAIVQSHIHEF
ncbi:XRE family transcriptional regulator [Maribellus luteus]|uniref:XRE family transcriptional regulator n=1 Tax=Maribellus luteus TaxID=2305463 RepID=A0A399SNC2_9BACT|nr:helix-turn-helix transcriptional regulator [Maribellus luteus]RIJ45496.1 XRE family transcriptional regulator [Maribellus luteus]